jgi:hypothetical protein
VGVAAAALPMMDMPVPPSASGAAVWDNPTSAQCPVVTPGVLVCCRMHRSRYAFAALDRQTSVVASPRLALAAPNTWQGILTHEMGHCIDFFAFPQ